MATFNNENNNIVIPNMNEPSKPITMVTIPHSITLTSTTYLSWKTQIEAILIGYDLYRYLDGTFAVPPTTITKAKGITNPNPAYQTWFRQDKIIFGALVGTISSDLVPLISHSKTAHEMWDILAKTYDKPKPVPTLGVHIITENAQQVIDLTSPPSSPSNGHNSASTQHKRRRKNNNVNKGGHIRDKVDRISDLPNDITVHMLSFVDVKTAGRTSILSKGWRHIWTLLCDLDFEHTEYYMQFKRKVEDSEINRFSKWVNEVITANRAPYLNTFRIHFPLNGSNATDINKWVKYALSKKVCNLEVNLSNVFGNARGVDFYTIQSDFLLISPVYNDHLTTLKSLHLEAIAFDGSVLENVLASCLNLENLTVRKCRFYRTVLGLARYSPPNDKLVVCSLKLKHLEVCRCHQINKLEISAPKLYSFTYFIGWPPNEVKYVSIPSLVNVTFGCGYIYNIFRNSNLLSAFSHRLEKLSLHWNWICFTPPGLPKYPEDSLLHLIPIIEACPLLHTFKLELWHANRQGVPMSSTQKDVKINYAMREHQQLKVVEIVGFDGSVSVAEFVFCITKNAPMLKKIICDPRCPQSLGTLHNWYDNNEFKDRIAPARSQARLLSKQIRGVDVVIL